MVLWDLPGNMSCSGGRVVSPGAVGLGLIILSYKGRRQECYPVGGRQAQAQVTPQVAVMQYPCGGRLGWWAVTGCRCVSSKLAVDLPGGPRQ